MWGNLVPDKADIGAVYAPLAHRGREFGSPWSIAELLLSDDDVDWLGRWFAALPAETTLVRNDLLQHALPRDQFAALLLALGSELCRSHSRREDAVWPTLNRLIPRTLPLWQEAFHPNGQPTYLLRLAINEAVRALNLRNVIDVEGTQQWYVTVKLQFGFTLSGARVRLAEWLVGYNSPLAIQYLVGEAGSPEYASRSFRSLWMALRQYRRSLINDEQAREVLGKSPWVKRAWIDDLLVEARARIETLGPGDETPSSKQASSSLAPPEEAGPLESIGLDWPDEGKPRIVFRLDRDAITEQCRDAGCTELDFCVDGQRTGRWTLQSDGTWDGRGSAYAEPGAQPQQVNLCPRTLAIRSGEGELIQQWDLADCGLLGDVQVFDLDEERLVETGFEQLNPTGRYALVCDRAYSLAGCTPSQVYDPPTGARKALKLPAPLPRDLELSYEGFTLWQPVASQEQGRPRVTATLMTYGDRTVSVGERTRLTVDGLPAETNDVGLLVGKRVEPADRLDAGWTSAHEVVMTPELASRQKVVRVRLRLNEQTVTIVPKLGLRLKGIAAVSLDARHPEAEPKLNVLDPDDLLSRTADGAQLRVWVTDEATSTRAFEGHCFVGPLRHGRMKLKDLPGLGGKLIIRGEDVHTFENACVDGGWIRDVNPVGIGRPAQVSLRVKRRPEPNNHIFVAWVSHGEGRAELVVLPPDALQGGHESRDWLVTAPDNMMALALTWQGTWLGAYWWFDRIRRSSFQPTATFFAAVRWLRLPILHPDLITWLAPLVLAKPFAFLEAWFQDKGLPDGIRKLDHEPAHDTVVRQFIGHWRPQQDAHFSQAVQMICGGGELRTREQLLHAVIDASRHSPPLLWWLATKLAREGNSAVRETIGSLLGLAADQHDRQATYRLDVLRRSTSQYCAFNEERLRELEMAVLQWLGHPAATLPTREHHELLLVLGSESGQRYLTARILLQMIQDQGRAR
jgi:hypothetical protein